MIIRPARTTDAVALAKIHVDTWRSDYRGIVPDNYLVQLSLEEERLNYLGMIGDPDTLVFAAEDEGGGVVGLAVVSPFRDEGYTLTGTFSAELRTLYVTADLRKAGVGRGLVRAVSEALRARGLNSLLVWTFEGYVSSSFYERLGGRLVGRRRIEIGGRKINDLAYGWEDISVILER